MYESSRSQNLRTTTGIQSEPDAFDESRFVMTSSTCMYESSRSQNLRTATGIQSEPDAFDESRFVMTFLTFLGVTEICSFRLVLEGKTGKEIPESSRL